MRLLPARPRAQQRDNSICRAIMRVSTPSQTRRGAVPPCSRISLSYFLAGIKADARLLSRTEASGNNYLFDTLRYARYPAELLFRSLPSVLAASSFPSSPRADRSIGFGITNRDRSTRGTDRASFANRVLFESLFGSFRSDESAESRD